MRPIPNAAPLAATLALALAAAPAGAQVNDGQPGAPAQQQSPTPGPAAPQTPEAETGFWTRSNLLGDPAGARGWLGEHGITLGLQETGEVFGNVSGGIRRGAAYDGLTLMGLGVDTEKAFGWKGGSFNVTALQIHGRNLSADNLLVLQPVSGIEAVRSTRLWEIWYQQAFLDGRLDLKLGQQSLDQEFALSTYQSVFLNAAMGWPALGAADLYAGGPAYPLASLGIRLRGRLSDQVTVLAGVFDDNPPGGPFFDDSQVRGAAQSGTRFNLRTGALVIGEVQYAYAPEDKAALPGTYKLGFWVDTGRFPSPRFDTAGVPLAAPDANGLPMMLRPDFAVYGVVDQMVWHPDPEGPRALGVFARVVGAPGNRNLLDFSANAGVSLKAPLPGRDNDTVALGFGIAKMGGAARGFDRDVAFYGGAPYPVRSAETFLEITYQFQATPWLTLQPDFQYVWLPSGGIPNPLDPARRVGNAAVFGLRSNIVF